MGDRVKHMTKDQKVSFDKLREEALKWDLTDAEKDDIMNDFTIYRYCFGYGFDIDTCKDFLRKTIDWRRKFQPENLRLKDLKHSDKNMIFQYGIDKEGHPIIWIVLKNDTIENDEDGVKEKFKLMVYNFEACIRQMKEPVTGITIMVELEGGYLTLGIAQTLKAMFDELGIYYTERSHRIIVLNAGWTLSFIWAFVKSFLPQHVIDKYIFVSGYKDDIKKELSKYAEEDQLAFYGSTDIKYDKKTYLEREVKIFGSN